ncbi:hypothetical protein HDF09_003135 [Edaphobacter lichenicola]|uniref:Uncharacterized protein n=1 Tax=Tunturiibacter empetritectus TaxID=3069691 RepID=A0A7W8IJV8_9BACT|nr:hypothetical protein [Edaphobacter lichenicola]
MAYSGADRTLPPKGRYSPQIFDRGPGSLRVDVGYLDRGHASSAGRRTWKKEGTERQGVPPARIVVEQWICFVLGFLCMAFGIWGLCIQAVQSALSSYMAWLGSLYLPTLRVTAMACVGFGLTLIRRGWAHL